MTTIDLAAVIEAIADAVMVCDRDGTIRVWNAAAARQFGFARDEAVGAQMDIIIPAAFRGEHWRAFRAAMLAGTTYVEHQVLPLPTQHKDGTQAPIAATVGLIRSAAGAIDALAVVMRPAPVQAPTPVPIPAP